MVLYKKVMKDMTRMVYTTRTVYKTTLYYLTVRTTEHVVFQFNPFL